MNLMFIVDAKPLDHKICKFWNKIAPYFHKLVDREDVVASIYCSMRLILFILLCLQILMIILSREVR